MRKSLRATEGSTPRGWGAGLPPRCQPLGHAGQILRSAPWIQSKQGFRRRLPQEIKRGESLLKHTLSWTSALSGGAVAERARSVRCTGLPTRPCFYGSRSGGSVPLRISAPSRHHRALRKNRDAVPSPGATGLPRTACFPRHPSGPRPAVAAQGFRRYDVDGCRPTGWLRSRRPEADRRRAAGGQRSLVDRPLPARGPDRGFSGQAG